MRLLCRSTLAAGAAALAGFGCGQTADPGTTGSTFNIQVAPLDGGISDACYKIEVFATDSVAAFNNDPATGNLVWQEDSLCSTNTPIASTPDYGVNGELRYTGVCSDSEGDTDGTKNAVRLTINSLSDGATDLLATGFINPCPAASDVNDDNGCIIVADCKTSQDTQVAFDLTVMRQAQYGFFDVAVRFNEIFCAAKVDCTDDNGDTLEFLQKSDGSDGDTVVLGLACFGGTTEAGEPNPLFVYLDDITVDCGANEATVFTGNGPGNLDPADYANTAGTFPVLFGAAVNQGAAMEGGIYVNVLLGMNTYANCTLTAEGTASPTSLGGASPYETPAAANYPYIDFNVTLGLTGTEANPSGRTCSKHPLFGTGDSAGVSAPYSGVDVPAEFDNEFAIAEPATACPCWTADERNQYGIAVTAAQSHMCSTTSPALAMYSYAGAGGIARAFKLDSPSANSCQFVNASTGVVITQIDGLSAAQHDACLADITAMCAL